MTKYIALDAKIKIRCGNCYRNFRVDLYEVQNSSRNSFACERCSCLNHIGKSRPADDSKSNLEDLIGCLRKSEASVINTSDIRAMKSGALIVAPWIDIGHEAQDESIMLYIEPPCCDWDSSDCIILLRTAVLFDMKKRRISYWIKTAITNNAQIWYFENKWNARQFLTSKLTEYRFRLKKKWYKC